MSERRAERQAHIRRTDEMVGMPEGRDLECGLCGLVELKGHGIDPEPEGDISEETIAWLKERQPKVPTLFFCELRKRVAGILNAHGHKVYPHTIPFLTAVGTKLDRHGVDFLVVYKGAIVTADVTERASKLEIGYARNAHLLIPGAVTNDGVPFVDVAVQGDAAQWIANAILEQLYRTGVLKRPVPEGIQ